MILELDNPLVHIKKGICHAELNELDKAADSFIRAYMLEGEQIFQNEDSKYFDFLKNQNPDKLTVANSKLKNDPIKINK